MRWLWWFRRRSDREHAARMAAERERTLREFDEVTEQMWWNR